jgi:hypothetical protein
MSSSAMKYGQLYNYLESLGYKAQVIEKHIVFRMPHRELPVILPKVGKTQEVRPSHLAAVERILVLDGVVRIGHLPGAMSPTYSASKTSSAKLSRVKATNSKAVHVKAANSRAAQLKATNSKAAHVKATNSQAVHAKAANSKAAIAKAIKAKSSKS